MNYDRLKTRSGRSIKYNNIELVEKNLFKKNEKLIIIKVKKILEKSDSQRTNEDRCYLNDHNQIVKKIDDLKKLQLSKTIHNEIVIDDDHILESKCEQLANAIHSAKFLVVYTGAGISTSSSIPDYRGPNGLWTLLKKGIKVEIPDFALVAPTYSHLILKELLDRNIIKHIISQNCDGLHLRSGISDRQKLSELHGNCFIERCSNCNHEYVRLFDVTQNSRFRKHNTGRHCDDCKTTELNDTIIHFGEKLKPHLPYNLELAEKSVSMADCIICIGSSLKVLKHYKWLWPDKKRQDHDLYIMNIQWTPKDKHSKLKLNGYCDHILSRVVFYLNRNFNLNIDHKKYNKNEDPLLKLATRLTNLDEVKNQNKKEINSAINENDATTTTDTNVNTNSWYNRSFKNSK